MTTIVPTEDSHISYMAIRARGSDKEEVYRATGGSMFDALWISRDCSQVCLTLVGDDGLPVCIFGVAEATDDPTVGIPWLICTDALRRHRKTFHRHAIEFRDAWLQEYDTLENYCDSENTETIRWLTALGYRFDEPAPYGPFGHKFQRFHACA